MPRWILTVGSATLWLAVAGCPKPPRNAPMPPPPPPRADLLLEVKGVVGAEGASALAVKDGRVVEIGPRDALAAWIGPDTEVLRLPGGFALPGLVDAHMHLTGLGERRLALDLVGTGSLEEVLAKVREAGRTTPEGEWILGRGWDQNDWGEGAGFPTAEDLDRAAPDHPVALTRIDGHALWANRQAMARAEVTPRTRPAEGGRIVMRRGRPSGIFIDNAMTLIRDRIPPLDDAQRRKAVLLAQRECLAAGLTGVHDMGVSLDELAVLRALDEEGALKIRVYAAHDGTVEDLTPALSRGPEIPDPSGPRRLTVRAVKLFADGALGSRGAALLAPYADDADNRGLMLTDPSVLEARVRTAHAEGFQVATHAIGDRANREVLDIYRRVFGDAAWRARPRVEHAQVLAPEDLPRFGAEGVIASVQPTHATSDMPWAEKRLGADRVQGAYAWQSLLTTGATVAAGSDAPVEDVSPILGLYAATTRKDQLGLPEAGWYPGEAMTKAQALDAFTTGAAWAAFAEDDLGRLERGKLADVTVLSVDPTEASEDALITAQVLATIVGGEVAHIRADAVAPAGTSSVAYAEP